MIDHVSIQVSDLLKSSTFYEQVLAFLGLKKMVARETTVGFGKLYPEFWLNSRPDLPRSPVGTGAHICLRATSKDAVKAFHRTAIDLGGMSGGNPAERLAEKTSYYGAFILDLDGNKIEAATFPLEVQTGIYSRGLVFTRRRKRLGGQ